MATSPKQSLKAEPADGDAIEVKVEPQVDSLDSMRTDAIKDDAVTSATNSPSLKPLKLKASRSSSSSTVKSRTTSTSSVDKKEVSESIHKASIKMEQEVAPKSSRSASQKAVPRAAMLFDHLADSTAEAQSSFVVIDHCTYSNKSLGLTEHAMECDCAEEWDVSTKRNNACGDDSDCINRATKMECVGDCACGLACQNQRFQQRQFANVSVIKTEKKGYGLRADADLRPGEFIFEYIGEVINETQFRRRMINYDEEGIKHFYFMSLSKGEFVDATKKGNLGRFCNHSCSPNCYVDKWVVGDKLRMGIFAERSIKAGEELVFNYNVDRYGANPQPCYCGEPNCTGFIGGKTQTERATKLSAATIEALGIDDADSWDTAVAKRPKKKKTGEDDEDYVDSVEAKSLDTDGVTKVMAALMQCKEKWIAVKLLQRIQRCEDEQVRSRVVKVHGYQILNSQLSAWREDVNVVLQILDILDKLPRLTRNKIVDSKIESTLQSFTENEDERVSAQSATLLEEWSKLEVAYRIPRKKRDPNESSTPVKTEPSRYDRRDDRRESNHERKRSRSSSRTPPRGPSTASAPSGPRSSLPQRNSNFYPPRPPPFARPFNALPEGWFQATDNNGRNYYYSKDGQTTWARPTQPARAPPPPPKQPSNQDVLKSIIDNIVSAKEKEKDVKPASETPKVEAKGKKEKKEEKWKSYDESKKKKLYENTLFPLISHVMNKYKAKIPRDDLKRFAKEIAKKLVESDFKSGRVIDPTKISEKHQQKVKKFCKDYFEKAAYKHARHEKERAARKANVANRNHSNGVEAQAGPSTAGSPSTKIEESPDLDIKKEEDSDNEDVKMSDDEDDEEKPTPVSPSPANQNGDGLKRKRSFDETDIKDEDDMTKSPLKKVNLDSPVPPPPPPPGPPSETPDGTPRDSEDASPMEVSLHADTSFKNKSMADVLAEAQQDVDEGEDEVKVEVEVEDTSMQEANTIFENGLKHNGMLQEDGVMENPVVDGQAKLEELKDALLE